MTPLLGVAWSEIDGNGGAEIVGVSDRLIERFSKRRAQVEAAGARLVGEREAALGRSLVHHSFCEICKGSRGPVRVGVTASVGRPSRATMTPPPPTFSGPRDRQQKDAP